MCGITGYVGTAAPESLAAMLRYLAHRGPDDAGTPVERDVGLGMTRLAIIDLTTGQQPMAIEDDPEGAVLIGHGTPAPSHLYG